LELAARPGTMTNYKEEQELELEALESIFEEGKELEKISPTEFLLKFKPFPQDEEENFVGVILRIAYTDEYPETAPDWDLKEMWQDAISDAKLAELQGKVEEAIESSLGMAMVYTIAELCQDWLKENNVKALSMHEEMMKRIGGDEVEDGEDDPDNEAEVDKLEEEEWKGLKDKPMCAAADRITMDIFLDWKKRFDDEMVANGTLRREENKAKTGKAIFLEAQASEASKGKTDKEGGEMVYNAALFGEEDNEEDLDDLDFDDEEETGKAGYP